MLKKNSQLRFFCFETKKESFLPTHFNFQLKLNFTNSEILESGQFIFYVWREFFICWNIVFIVVKTDSTIFFLFLDIFVVYIGAGIEVILLREPLNPKNIFTYEKFSSNVKSKWYNFSVDLMNISVFLNSSN